MNLICFRLAGPKILWVGAIAALAASTVFALETGHLPPAQGIHCSLEKVKDDQRSGVVAFTYFVPEGWKSQSSFNWNGNVPATELSASTPDQKYLVDRIQPTNFGYSDATGTAPKGVKITNATDYLHLLVGKMQEQDGVTDLKVIEEYNTDLPLADTQVMMQKMPNRPGMSSKFFRQNGFLKVSFMRGSVEEIATLGTTVLGDLSENNMRLGFGSTARQFHTENDFYVAGPTLQILNPSDPSPARIKEAKIAAASMRITPEFSLFCAKLALKMSEDALHRTEEQGREFIKKMQADTARGMADFRERMAAKDATTHEFCNYVSDQQDYKSVDGSVVTLPAYYSHVWDNGTGGYILTNDVIDPRQAAGTWHEIPKTHPGE